MPKVLIVDDDPGLLRIIKFSLEDVGFEVDTAVNGKEALLKVDNSAPDIMILDVMMPEIDGFAVCQRIKNDPATSHIGVIMLTARRTTEDKIIGFDSGADDYVTKPFVLSELVARVKAQWRIKELQKRLIDAEKRNLLAQLIITLSHSINNPLTVIFWYLEELLKSFKNNKIPENVVSSLELILEHANKIKEITDKLRKIEEPVLRNYWREEKMIDLDESIRRAQSDIEFLEELEDKK